MDTILRTIPAHFDGTHVRFDVEGIEQELLPNTPLLVTVLTTEQCESESENSEKVLSRDFSVFAGKLKWKGDAVAEQRKLRDTK